MTIQRQYSSLPNCKLILEGLSTITTPNSSPPMSVLVNAECHFPGLLQQPLTGGREFIESLVTAVSLYVQEQLSGLRRPSSAPADKPPLVHLQAGEGLYHHLIVQPQLADGKSSDSQTQPPIDIKLTTVQLFDLLEAVDQLLADTQTLPDLKLDLTPLSRRLVKTQEPIVKQATPAVIGVSTLAAAAALVFFLPVPEFKIPERPPAQTEVEDAENGSDPPQTESPPPPSNTSENSGLIQGQPDAVVTPTPEEPIEQADEITDPDKLAELRQILERQISQAWEDQPNFDQALVYRVMVSAAGDIVDFNAENDAASANRDQTPLTALAFIPVGDKSSSQEPIAQFKVTFSPNGNLEISPWSPTQGSTAPTSESGPGANLDPETESGLTSPVAGVLDNTIPNEIEDPDQIYDLYQKLYESIRDNRARRGFGEILIYRVRVNESGSITGYQAVNRAAANQINQTPLPKLVTASEDLRPDDSQVDFKLVITSQGIIEINPWRGWSEE